MEDAEERFREASPLMFRKARFVGIAIALAEYRQWHTLKNASEKRR